MKMNLPVTTLEYPIGDETLIVSKTDIKGRITYVNDDFIEASGFAEQELIGQPHNIVRHPDMPPEAFDNLWQTLKEGKPWAGAVKNRRKNGDYYWVLASATPIWENGQITGYMSIRTRLPADQRREAERVYGLIREKKPHPYTLAAGILRRRSFADHFTMFTGTLKARLTTMAATFAGFMLLVGLVGILAAHDANQRLQSVYNDRVMSLLHLLEVNNLTQKNIFTLIDASIGARVGKDVGGAAATITSNAAAITKAWDLFMESAQPPEAKAAAETYEQKRREFVERGMKPSVSLLAAKKYDDLDRLLSETAYPLFTALKQAGENVIAIEVAQATHENESARRSYAIAVAVAIGALLVGIVLGGLLGRTTIRAVSGPVERMIDLMKKIAQGEFNSRVLIERDDEIGVALRHLQATQAKLGFDSEVQRQDEARRYARTQRVEELVHSFDAEVAGMLAAVTSQATELQATAKSMSDISEETAQQSTAVTAAFEEASANVQSVAASTEEMTSSISEISRQVHESARIAGEAVEQAHMTNDRVNALSRAATRIGDVVELINSIAGQTNLLALNATIEAARAGEVGRGFAVVASEVKALAEQTAKATGEISQQIADIQTATQESAAAIKEISGTIGRISEISSTIAAAVEEQGAATQEISRNVHQAAQGTQQMASNITDVQRGASETGVASSRVLSSAQLLSLESNRLKQKVDKFLTTVRAA
jgi:aerotaxis receptor